MAVATLTTKGQVTIPKEIREQLCLHSGDKIEFFVKSNGEATIRPMSCSVDDVFCKLNSVKQKPVSIEEMNQAIKDRFKGEYL